MPTSARHYTPSPCGRVRGGVLHKGRVRWWSVAEGSAPPKKPLHPSLRRAGRKNPRIVKARSSHEISREHELPGAWQYVSISLAMWERKRYGYLYVLSCLQGAHKCAEYQWLSVVEQAGMRRFNVKRSTFNVWWCAPLFINYVLVKNHYTVWKLFLSSSFLSPKTTNCYLDVIIYILF